MDEEVQKWSKKDPAAIRRSMAKPERLELLEKGFLKELYGSSGMSIDWPIPIEASYLRDVCFMAR